MKHGGKRTGAGRPKLKDSEKTASKVIRVKILEWEEFLKWKKKFN